MTQKSWRAASMTSTMTRTMLFAGAAGAICYALPAFAALGPVRRRFLPALSGEGDPRHVALTFDDGPHPFATPEMLWLLAEHQVRATFFVLGRRLTRYPWLGSEIVDAGHEIGVHGWDDSTLVPRTRGAVRADLARTVDLVLELTGARPRWWRPPHGVATTGALAAARGLGLRPVLATPDADWVARAGTGQRSATGLVGGTTIVLRDGERDGEEGSEPTSWPATTWALPHIIRSCHERGLRVGPLAEHGIRPSAAAVGVRPAQAPEASDDASETVGVTSR
jgi:peptidoglycan/xylan/chitin deacetylase (PgdA/CDA1 family)